LSATAFLAGWSAARAAPSLFHAHDAHGLILAGLAARLTRSPLVVTRRVQFPIRRPGFWARADRVIAVSAAVRTSLIDRGISANRITVIPSSVDLLANRQVAAGSVRADLRLPLDQPLAVSVAALTREKDQLTLLATAALLARRGPSIHWAVAGAGPLRAILERRACDLGIDPFIHFLGALEDPRPLIKAADLLVSTSTSEGLGTSILDAMTLGTPVVATDVGGVPELLSGGAGLLVEPGNPEALAAGVTQVVTDQPLRESMTERATQEVARFGAGRMAEAVALVYRSVALER
jgi:glycosyltransferase involved in cell wall biosynthesis